MLHGLLWIIGILAISACLLSVRVWWLSKLVAFAKNRGILQTRIDQNGDHMKINFDYFQIQKWMWQTQ